MLKVEAHGICYHLCRWGEANAVHPCVLSVLGMDGIDHWSFGKILHGPVGWCKRRPLCHLKHRCHGRDISLSPDLEEDDRVAVCDRDHRIRWGEKHAVDISDMDRSLRDVTLCIQGLFLEAGRQQHRAHGCASHLK